MDCGFTQTIESSGADYLEPSCHRYARKSGVSGAAEFDDQCPVPNKEQSQESKTSNSNYNPNPEKNKDKKEKFSFFNYNIMCSRYSIIKKKWYSII